MSFYRATFSVLKKSARSARTQLQNPYALSQTRYISATQIMKGPLSDKIIYDHAELDEYYQKIMSSSDADTMTRYQNLFTWELARHSIAEELVVYPAMEKYLGQQGKEMADKDRDEHQKIKEDLYKFQGMKASDPDFKNTLHTLYRDLKQHIEEEEREDLPALEKGLSSDESESYAASFERTKRFTPTRSHPSAPNKPPFETVAGLMAAPLDKISDLFRKFP